MAKRTNPQPTYTADNGAEITVTNTGTGMARHQAHCSTHGPVGEPQIDPAFADPIARTHALRDRH